MQLWKYDSKLLPIIFNLYVLTKSFCGLKRYKKKEKKYMFVALYLFFFFVCLFVWFFQNFPRCNIFIKKYHIKLVMFSRDVKNDIRVMLYIKKTKKKKQKRKED